MVTTKKSFLLCGSYKVSKTARGYIKCTLCGKSKNPEQASGFCIFNDKKFLFTITMNLLYLLRRQDNNTALNNYECFIIDIFDKRVFTVGCR